MKIFFRRFLLLFLIILICSSGVLAVPTLIPGGQIIGLELQDGSVTVSGLHDSLGDAAKNAGLRPGDRLLKINSTPITCVQDVRDALRLCDGTVKLCVRRGQHDTTLTMSPIVTQDGPKLGVYLRQGMTGLGTVTYYDPQTGDFAALGHGVNGQNGELLPMDGGNAFSARVYSIKKGKAGKPGQLLGALTQDQAVGSLSKNTQQGIFGSLTPQVKQEPLPVAAADDVRTGPAVIRCTVEANTLREYSVEILKIYPNRGERTRNMLIKVTDPALLNATGGIVQGMSGSPIIQDGKLVGAVTHVLVNDPTMGYGIFIENMLDAAA